MTHSATLATAWRYPVKSMLGEELNAAAIGPTGLIGDRAYALVDRETGAVVSAKNPKKWPDIFACRASYLDNVGSGALPAIHITLPDGSSVRSDLPDSEERISKALGRAVNLRSAAPAQAKLEQFWPEYEGQNNEISQEPVAGDAPAGTFFDYAMVHLITTSSLQQLASLHPAGRIEVRRFRPNLVVDTAGQEGFVENAWVGRTLRIGDSVRLQITDPCPRCVMPTLAQGDLPKDPLIFREAIAKNNVTVPFAGKALPSVGVYARVLSGGTVRRGDAAVLE
ncbi:MOSC domain-containing protein [Methyloterricola oryzae]|uniref:MOSC domain-containing protein n=1 Tax=Methyloterricola oryzae TaxID=1495050 RepID=UPI0005EAE903|nr:MOSC domain-containing protein [Methyloterricola oryzae]